MGISINVFNVPLAELGPLAQHAEKCGFERILFGDHLIAPMNATSLHPRSDPANAKVLYENTPLTDLLVTFGYLSALTDRIGFATGVYILPVREPVATARAAATVQLISGGRFTFGVGAGWMREEFDIVNIPFETRGKRFDEMIELMKALWTGDVVDHHGTFWDFEQVQLWPPPEPPIPLIFGGTSVAALRRAARHGDGWFSPTNHTMDELLATRDELERIRVEAGTVARPFTYYVRVEGAHDMANVERYRREGFEDLVLATSREWRRRDEAFTLDDKLEMLSRRAHALELL
jgi:probable F420-dependent oxidoreductase